MHLAQLETNHCSFFVETWLGGGGGGGNTESKFPLAEIQYCGLSLEAHLCLHTTK